MITKKMCLSNCIVLLLLCIYRVQCNKISDVSTVTSVAQPSVIYKPYEDQLNEYEYKTSPEELGIEPYGAEAAARIWSPTRLIPAEEWSGFYSGPVSDDWPTGSVPADQVASESGNNNSSISSEVGSSAYAIVYQDTPKREHKSDSDILTSTTNSPATPNYSMTKNDSSLGSETAPHRSFEDSSLWRESNEEVSEYDHQEDSSEDGYKRTNVDGSNFEDQKVSESVTQLPVSFPRYQMTPVSTETIQTQISDQGMSESNGPEVIRALSRIETEQFKHEAVHFNQTNPVVYDPIAKAQSESTYLKHSPLSKHDPFDQKIHSYQYIFGPGPSHNDGKLHSFEETHEYHYPTQYLKRSDRHEHHSSSPLSVRSKANDAGRDRWKTKNVHRRQDPPGKAHLETYFFEGESGRKSVIHEPGSARAASKTMEMDLRDWDGGNGHVSGCFGTGCRYRPKSSMYQSRHLSSDLSPIRPFSSFFAPSPSRDAPRFHSNYDDHHYGLPPPPPRRMYHDRDHGHRSSSRNYKESKIPSPRRPMYKPHIAASFSTKPRVNRYESPIKNSDGSRNRPSTPSSNVYHYSNDPNEYPSSYNAASKDQTERFYEPKFYENSRYQGSSSDKYEDSYENKHRPRQRYSSPLIPDPTPYFGPYQRYFPDLIASPSSSGMIQDNEYMSNPMEDDSLLFNSANPVSNYNFDHPNERNNFW